jgi:TfoX/Sxy family transcriptional regulator of competence genes
MKWIKAPDALKAHIDSLMKDVECERRPMFGYPAYFINKNMFAGLFGDKVFLRLPPDQVASLSKSFPGLAHLEPMPGRPMKDYYELPEKLHKDPKRISKVILEAAEYCRTLPAKAKKSRKKV